MGNICKGGIEDDEKEKVQQQNAAAAEGTGAKKERELPTGDVAKKEAKKDKKDEKEKSDRSMPNEPQASSSKIQNLEDKITQHSHVAKKPKQRAKVMGKKIDVSADTPLPDKFPKTAEEEEFLGGALGDNFIFSALDEKEMKLLIDVMIKEKVDEGATIIKQGDVGDYFYVVESGTVNFIINEDMHVGSCTRGASFGELALLYDAPRAATCIADTDTVLWKVDQNTFRFLLAKNADSHEKKTMELLSSIPLFKGLGSATLTKFSNALTRVPFKTDDRIVNKGDAGEVFYLIEDGRVKIHDIGQGTEHLDNVIGPGQWFGERALLTGEPRAASATAITDVMTLAMDKETFEQAIGSLEKVLKHEMKKDCLEVLPIIAKSKILPGEMDGLVDHMTSKTYAKDEKLAETGKTFTPRIILIRKGKVSVYSASGKIHKLQDGDHYGDQTILGEPSTKHADTVVCDEETECFILTKEDIQTVIGDINRLGEASSYVSQSRQTNIKFEDVKKHRVLGQGAFGLVWLVSCMEDQEKKPYALKEMDKRELIDNKMVQGTIREKEILASLDHPFILPLIASFQDNENLYLLLTMIQGGELFNVIHGDSKRKGLSNEDSRFYAACICDALGHFHQRLICYRDLKPENILIDAEGYCIMVDLGFAKIVANKTYTLCGTPEYLAPEIITSKGHDKAVDWWAFGVLVYEMLFGRSPFYRPGADQLSLFKNIVRVKYSIPDHVDPDAADVISKLLMKSQATRLGNLAGAERDIKNHPWFKPIDFEDNLINKKYEAPWVPKVKSAFDASHFEDYSWAEQEKQKRRGKKLNPREQKQFEGF